VSLRNDISAISHAPSCICTQTCIHDISHIHVVSHVRVCVHISEGAIAHEVASINRLVKIIGVFCKRALYKRLYSAKEIYDFKELTNRSHRIPCINSMTEMSHEAYQCHP